MADEEGQKKRSTLGRMFSWGKKNRKEDVPMAGAPPAAGAAASPPKSKKELKKEATLAKKEATLARKREKEATQTKKAGPTPTKRKDATLAKMKEATLAHQRRESKAGKKNSKKKQKQKRHQAQKVRRGRLYVNLRLKGDTLEADIEEAKDLIEMSKAGDANPYVEVSVTSSAVKNGVQKSAVIQGTRKPQFKASFSWELPKLNKDSTMLRIYIHHESKGFGKKRSFMGGMAFSIAEIEDVGTITEGWFRLLDEQKAENQNVPFRVKRRHEMTTEQMEIYGIIGDAALPPLPTPAVSSPIVTDGDDYLQPSTVANLQAEANLGDLPLPALPSQPGASAKSSPGLSMEDFTYLKVLGQGAFGKVLMAERKANKEIVAIKVLSKEAVVDDDDVEATLIERRVLAKASDCAFLTKLHGTFQTPSHLYFVMEFITGGDLMFHAQKVEKFTEDQARFLVAEICEGLWYLHERGIVYRDLKLDNVMLAGDGHVKIADFGLSKESLWGAATTTTMCGTPGYMAPEIVNEKPYNFSVDWWALGVLLFEMLVGESPFDGDDVDEIFENIQGKEVEIPSSVSGAAADLIRAFLTRDVAKRLGCGTNGKDDIRNHKFFSGLSWTDLKERKIEPPYKPASEGDPLSNFDPEYTDMDIELTPVEQEVIADLDQMLFANFDFVAGLSAVESEEAPMSKYDWYRPDLNRQSATALLQSAPTGTFIVRESRQPNCYAVSVSLGSRVWHGVITPSTTATGDKLYKLYVKNKFSDIPELVNYYHEQPIALNPNGQPIVLTSGADDDE
ncbi:uncharacterized protein MONBRDRAFT_39232 [Monosiga brevicollis MX1]|uniref:Protein kinase C n=1 Tax=Monosiga brevicollis TaxID=81824 RepID=A9VD19_MONBE|nr:uncharacterized protein MONBRDRAFT_39232 [Monosiga brevicollis MX1]EDQ84600.1 predicted protein [Monosiga brevicollis MX1]|eukprot:XP_001750627.1 hypothetical protein [Monosiga brevicollis MX1]